MTDTDKLKLENLNLRIANVELQGELLNRVQADLIQQRDSLKAGIDKDAKGKMAKRKK